MEGDYWAEIVEAALRLPHRVVILYQRRKTGATLRLSLIVAVIALTSSVDLRAEPAIPRCSARFAELLSNKVFHDYPAETSPGNGRAVAPLVKTGKAHLYRTAIRDGAKEGLNFAGHYTLIRIGCGAATVCVAITDRQNGRVYFPPELTSATSLLVDTAGADIETLNYRPDSQLLIVVGTPNEKLQKAGISYFKWQSNRLALVKFTPAAKLCHLPASTQF